MKIVSILKNTSKWPIFLGILVSLLLSYLATLHTIVNPDGICYLMSAEEIGNASIQSAMHLCAQSHWPLLSLLIHGVVKVTHLSYLHAAYTLNAFFSALSVCMFMLIVKEAGASKRIIALAGAVILLSHEFNAVREYIIRDHGFWALYLTSIWLLIRYFQSPSIKLASTWYLSLIIATLFRIEGAIFLLAMPFSAWAHTDYTLKERSKMFLQLYSPSILIGLILLMGLVFYPHQVFHNLGRFNEVVVQIQHGFTLIAERFSTAKQQLANHVLTSDSANKAGLVLVLMMGSWYIASVVLNLSWGYAFLAAYAWIKKITPQQRAWHTIIAYLIINILITMTFLLERFFLSKRYLIALSLILMLWVPFTLDHLWKHKKTVRYQLGIIVISCIIAASAVSGIVDFGYSKQYIEEAGDWISSSVPPAAKLYANDYQLMYYSKHYGNGLFTLLPSYVTLEPIAHNKWQEYDYIAIRLTKHEKHPLPAMDQFTLSPIQKFTNKRGDKVLIYKINHDNRLDKA